MTNNDLISSAAAIEYFMTNIGWHDEDGYEVDDADEKRAIITDFFNGIPAVDAMPVVHGRWEKTNAELWQSCSECGVAVEVQSMYMCKASEDKNFNYCPHCGAKMDGGPDV